MYPGAERLGFSLGSLGSALSSWDKGGGEIGLCLKAIQVCVYVLPRIL